MFVISVKSSKLKSYLIVAFVALFTVLGGVISVYQNMSTPVANIGGIIMKGSTNEERITFFSQFGWKVDTEPCEIKEVVIPTEFDETYEKYNELQKAQDLNLEKYMGKRVKMYSYKIENFPNYENTDGTIRGNLLVYEGIIIGGDVSNIELDGFMRTFDGVTEIT